MALQYYAIINFPNAGSKSGSAAKANGTVYISTPTKFTSGNLNKKPTRWGLSSSTVTAGSNLAVAASDMPGPDHSKSYTATLVTSENCKYTATLKHNTNGGDPISNRSYSKQDGSTTTLYFDDIEDPNKTGLTFYGWAYNSTTTTRSISPGGSTSISFTPDSTDQSKTQNIYAIWSITQSFNANGGSFGSSTAWNSTTQYVQTGSKTFTIPGGGPTKTDCLFLGWAKSDSATTAEINANNSAQTVNLSENTTWYAVWGVTDKLTQHFDANGGTFGSSTAWADQTITVQQGGSATFSIPGGGPTRSGYVFIGWSANSWTDTPYSPLEVAKLPTTIVLTQNKTWFAVWWKTPLVLQFDANGGSFGTSTAWNNQSVSRTYNGTSDIHKTVTFTIPANGPTKDGYVFKGWSVSQTSDTPEYNRSSSAQTFTSSTDKTLYAVWHKRPIYIKIGDSIVEAYPYIKINDEIHECYFYMNNMID